MAYTHMRALARLRRVAQPSPHEVSQVVGRQMAFAAVRRDAPEVSFCFWYLGTGVGSGRGSGAVRASEAGGRRRSHTGGGDASRCKALPTEHNKKIHAQFFAGGAPGGKPRAKAGVMTPTCLFNI